MTITTRLLIGKSVTICMTGAFTGEERRRAVERLLVELAPLARPILRATLRPGFVRIRVPVPAGETGHDLRDRAARIAQEVMG